MGWLLKLNSWEKTSEMGAIPEYYKEEYLAWIENNSEN
jgi:hypothetical protein